MPTVDPGQARQHQDNLQDAVQEFIKWLKYSSDQQQTQDDPDIEIKIGRDIVFQHKGGKIIRDKLTPERIQLIKDAISTATQPQSQRQIKPSALKISIGNETIYHRDAQGNVKVNQFDQILHSQKNTSPIEPSKASDSQNLNPEKTSENPTPPVERQESTATQPEALNKAPDSQNSNPEKTAKNPTPPVEHQESTVTQPEAVNSEHPLTETPRVPASTLVESRVLPRIPQDTRARGWITHTTSTVKAAKNWAKNRVQDISNHTTTQTASRLLERYGTRQPDGAYVYESQGYTIRATGKNDVTIADRYGNLLMHYQETALGRHVISDAMDRFHKRNFLKAHPHCRDPLSTPTARARALGSLAPLGDLELIKTEQYVKTYRDADRILHEQGNTQNGITQVMLPPYQLEKDLSTHEIRISNLHGTILMDRHGLHPECSSHDRKAISTMAASLIADQHRQQTPSTHAHSQNGHVEQPTLTEQLVGYEPER